MQLLSVVLALAAALLLTAILVSVAGADVREGFVALYEGAFGSGKAIAESLVKATPLILTGLATVVAFRARVWNIGQEGQLFAGAIFAYWAYVSFDGLPPAALFAVVLLAAMVGGAICAMIAAVVKARFGVDVIITTIMLNYIIAYLLSWLLSGPWRDPNSYYQHSPSLPEAAHFPLIIGGTRLHIGFAVGLVASLIIYLLLEKTPRGYEIRAFGFNPIATEFQGTNVVRLLIIVMLISGGIAGLAGAGELFGIHYRLKSDISLGYGYTGIIIAMLAGLQPLVVVPAAIFFGGLVNGAFRLQVTTGVPASLVYVIQAAVLLFLLTARAVVNYRIRRPEP